MSFPFFRRKPQVIGSSDPRAMIAGDYRYPNGERGGEIRVGDTRPKVEASNLLTRTGISQFVIDTRLQAAAVAAPWRRTVDDDVFVSNSYGSLSHLPEYADLQGGAGINLLDAPELDPDNPLVFDHLNVMAETAFPSEGDSGNWRPPKTWWFWPFRDSIHRVRDGGGGCGVNQGFSMLRSG